MCTKLDKLTNQPNVTYKTPGKNVLGGVVLVNFDTGQKEVQVCC